MRTTGIEAAIAAAKMSRHMWWVGAAILDKNRVISIGYNRTKTSPAAVRVAKRFGTGSKFEFVDKQHGELSALLRAKCDVKRCDIYVCRLTATGFGMSRPCKLCLALLAEAGIRNIYYTTTEGWKSERLS